MQSSAKEISVAIAAAGGEISFERFMSLALYSPTGFYTTVGQAGRRGDFITSPEIGPLFGHVVANAIDEQWSKLGCPDNFTVVEVGAGPGTLARSIINSEPACRAALSYVAVEISEMQRSLHPKDVVSLSTMPVESFVGVVIANELLDNLPFRLFVFDGLWQEAYVIERDGAFLEILHEANDTPSWLPQNVKHGARIAIQDQAQDWLLNSLRLVERGAVIVFDYCTTTEAAAHGAWRDWLRTYKQHQSGGHYLQMPGLQDITAHLMVDQLELVRRADKVSLQSEWLQRNQINDLVEQGKAYWQENAAKPDVKAMKMRSRVSEAEALCDPIGLGSFKVLEWHNK